jgi:SprT protein
MTHVTKDIKDRVNAELNRCLAIASLKWPSHQFPFPTVEYTQRGTTAGTAYYNKWMIKLNPVLLMENVDDFIKRTVPHELAHLVDFRVYQRHAPEFLSFASGRRAKRSVHGETWKYVMRLFGADPSRCHSYDTTNARVKNRVRYTYFCKCGQVLNIGPKHHKKIQLGVINIKHSKCRSILTKDQFQPSTLTATTKPSVPPSRKEIPAPRAGSKLDRAMTILATHGGYNREQLIDKLRMELNMSRAGAQTYYYSAKKRLAA